MDSSPILWGTATSFRAPILKAGSTDFALAADWTPVAGDVQISKDGGGFVNITTLPTFISGSGTLSWSLDATETEATEIVIQVIDSATKAVQDTFFRFLTNNVPYLNVGVPQATQAAGDTAITLAATATAANNFYVGAIVRIISGDGVGQTRSITSYNGSTLIATIDRAWDVALSIAGATRSVYAIFPQASNLAPTATQIGTEVFDTQTIESGMTFRGAMRLIGAVLAGTRAGTGTGTESFNAAVTNAKVRVTATMDSNGNRTSVTTDQTP